MSNSEILKSHDFIEGYGCRLCDVKLIKSRVIHLNSVKHLKNYEKYIKSKSDIVKGWYSLE